MAVERLSQASIGTLNKYSSMMAGSAFLTDFQLISTQLISSTTATVTFSGISQSYRHLQVRVAVRSDAAAEADAVIFNFNGDTGTNYSFHSLMGTGSSVVSNATVSGTYGLGNNIPAATATTNSFGASIIDILDYSSTTKNKTTRSLGGMNSATTSYARFISSAWLSTAAITSIVLKPTGTNNFVAGSRISLYGWN